MSSAPAPVAVVDLRVHLAALFAGARDAVAPEQRDVVITIERPKQATHGDYACNLALQLAKQLKRNPRDVAQALIAAMPASPYIAKTEIAGAGFINVFVSAASKQAIVPHILNAGIEYGKNNSGADKKLQVEFVSANPTGPLHVGHGRGAAVGDTLSRVLAANGWNVTREFYYNDAGQQIYNLMRSVQLRCKGVTPESKEWLEDGYRGDYIIDVANAYMARETIVADDQHVTGKGDANDEEAIRHFAVAYLRREQDLDLRAFGVHFDVYSLESALYTDGKVEATVKQLIANGYTYEQDGALWLRTTDFGDDKDRVMRKAEGSYTYFVPDVAYHLNKWQRGFTRVINEQGADHHSTITRVRAGLQALNAGIPQGWPEYVLHQMVRVMKDGQEVKISKRAGSYVTLRDLIDEVGSDATRYFLVARSPDTQLVFDIDLAKSQTNDNPVYYIQYAHARICSVVAQWNKNAGILSESNVSLLNVGEAAVSLLNEAAEAALLSRLADFPETVASAARELAPHLIAFYLKDLAADFHSYYNATRLITDDVALTQARIALAVATRTVLRNGLALLGVSAPEKM